MGALVAVVNKMEKNAIPTTLEMLFELQHRGNDGYGISTSDSIITAAKIEDLKGLKIRAWPGPVR